MTGVETVLLRVAGTAAGTLIKSLLARAPGAGLAADPARPAPRRRKPPTELGDGAPDPAAVSFCSGPVGLSPPERLRCMS
ncbi:hypothetical protein ACFCXA_06185 [Streptomyces virginiae]|uniref:hypothetical protein n=1 Tax=Streptomyces virginiae TaxID=1961 RepID=UPI00324AEA5B